MSIDPSIIEEALYHCNKCGFCQATCPHYLETREEWTSARGLLRLARGVLEGQLPMSEGYARRLYQCFMCGACSTACPSGVQMDEVFLEARRELAAHGLLPEPLAELGSAITATGSVTGECADERLSWAQNLPFEPPVEGPHALIYFVGCVSSFQSHAYSPPQHMARLLEHTDADYGVLGGAEVCCGYPLYINGQVDEARELARANIAAVRAAGARQLVVTCASCYRTWREFYPRLLGEALDVEVLHATEWLARADLNLLPAESRVRATYHDPCNLGRGSGLYDAPRQLLNRLGVELVEMANAKGDALCCGGGGNMRSLEPNASRAVAELRMAQAAATGADLLVTACPQCERTLANARPQGSSMRVVDVVDLAWQCLAADDAPTGQ